MIKTACRQKQMILTVLPMNNLTIWKQREGNKLSSNFGKQYFDCKLLKQYSNTTL